MVNGHSGQNVHLLLKQVVRVVTTELQSVNFKFPDTPGIFTHKSRLWESCFMLSPFWSSVHISFPFCV